MADIRIDTVAERALARVIARRGAQLPPFAPDRVLLTGPGEALVMRPGVAGEALEAALAAAHGAIATVCDQTDAFVVFRLSGADRNEALVRLIPIELGDTAAGTILHHMAVLVWREDASVLIAGASSSAASLRHAIEQACAHL